MGYVYSDEQMMMATQVAYLDFKNNSGKCNQNVQEAIDAYISEHCTYDSSGNLCLKDAYSGDKYVEKQFEVVSNIVDLQNSSDGRINLNEWTIKNVCNDEHGTGYVGMLIDTGDGNAIIGNRGSESYDAEQLAKDWGIADIGLLESKLTTQQERAQKYMEELWYTYGDEYDSYSVTGHSLGGNLSEHMAINAPAAMREKIDHIISFDGPGFSDEYIKKNLDRINNMAGKMDRYQWSWVSALLLPLPGVTDRIIKAHNEKGKIFPVNLFYRHDTHNVEFDGNGNVQDGDESSLSQLLGPIVEYIEKAGDDPVQDILSLLGFTLAAVAGCKVVAFAIAAVYGLKLIIAAVQLFVSVASSIGEFIQNIYYNYIAPQVSGIYEVSISSMRACKADMLQDIRSMEALNASIDSLAKSIRYDSATSSYYKSRLLLAQNSLENNINKIKKLVNKLDTYANKYSSVDSRVAGYFV
ncbi:MAG: DUF2974 domain-containing protein [Lachnospiraceae bacterium]|nr:DUF2974 domain-containing protein [Candidatus Colinaster scatohippi]